MFSFVSNNLSVVLSDIYNINRNTYRILCVNETAIFLVVLYREIDRERVSLIEGITMSEDKLPGLIRDLGSRQKRVPDINRYCEDQFRKNRAQGFSKAKGYSSGTSFL